MHRFMWTHSVPHSDKWKVDLAKEILEVKNKKLEMQIPNYNELDEILEWHNFSFPFCIKVKLFEFE